LVLQAFSLFRELNFASVKDISTDASEVLVPELIVLNRVAHFSLTLG
jgi:hypothetical protein